MNLRDNHTSTLYGNYIITIGGKNKDNVTNSIIAFNMNTFTTCEERPSGLTATPRHSHSACLYKENKIIIFGGESDVATLNDTAVLTLNKTDRKLFFL